MTPFGALGVLPRSDVPWVDALGETKVHKLPAKACYDAGKPNEIEPAASVR